MVPTPVPHRTVGPVDPAGQRNGCRSPARQVLTDRLGLPGRAGQPTWRLLHRATASQPGETQVPMCHRHHLFLWDPVRPRPIPPSPVPHSPPIPPYRTVVVFSWVLTTALSLATCTQRSLLLLLTTTTTTTTTKSHPFFDFTQTQETTTHKELTGRDFFTSFATYYCTTLRIASHSSAAQRFVHPSLSPTFPKSVDHRSGSFGSRPQSDLTTRHLADTTAATSCQKPTACLAACKSGQPFCCSLFCPP